MSRDRVLVVDDDPRVQTYMHSVLGSHGFAVSCLDVGSSLLERLSAPQRPAVVLLDLLTPADGGMEILAKIQASACRVPVIVMSGVDQTRIVVQAMRTGAADYLVKPLEAEELAESIRSAIRSNRQPPPSILAIETPDDDSFFGVGSCEPGMARVKQLARRVADTDVPVLILGETGVGKEVLARFIHSVSGRSQQPFIKVNCAAVPADLLESELFGYERGAFTGAMRDKPGKFELAGSGTLLLDEIGEMSPLLQAKLLHVLQDGECYRLGGTRPVQTTCRILASTNRCLEELVAKGEFRQDLFFRLNVLRLEIPPLRARASDIPQLVDYFMTKYSARYERPVLELPGELMEAFHRYSWPGNIRQIENTIRRFVIVPDKELALSELARTGTWTAEGVDPASLSLRQHSALAAEQTERELVMRTLQEVNWNRKAAAKRLNICYKSLLNKLRRWQITQGASSTLSEHSLAS